MNETLKRSISGAIYIVILIASIRFSVESFFILFGIFLLFAVVEFCELVQLKKIIPISIAILVYLFFYKIKLNRTYDLILLLITILVAIKLILYLFNKRNSSINLFTKYLFLIGYILLPFVLITKLPFGIKGYNPSIIISIFILIWTNDTFAYIVGKSIGKHKLFERISPKKTIEGFVGGVVFGIIASLIISKFYIIYPML